MQIFNQETELEDSTHETQLSQKHPHNISYRERKRNKADSNLADISSAFCF